MAFTNEYVSSEDKARFDWLHMPCLRIRNRIGMAAPSFWTVDHERDAFFICTHHGREDDADKYVFLLWWNGRPLLIDMRQEYVGANTLIWHLTAYPPEYANQFDDMINVLHEALRVFGCSGRVERPIDSLDVQLKF